MRKALLLLTLTVPIPGLAQGPNLAGDWRGTLKPPGGELRLVLHITKGDEGRMKATLDSVDQGANGIPVTTITLKGSKLSFAVDSVQGSYEGTVDASGEAIAGTWTQGGQLPLDFQRAKGPAKAEPKPAKPTDIDGAWMGTLDAGAVKLRLVIHLFNTEDGLRATMDSPDQNMKGMPATSVKREGTSLTVEMKQIGGHFSGTISSDLGAMIGTWEQNGASFPLTLKRVKDAAELERRRPQNPARPYPYREEEVAYQNPAAGGIKLAATLTVPPGKGPFPAAVLIAGSGPHDRDETLMGHKPFLVLADYLTRRGIVVLRADKRGVGESEGDYSRATTADFASDAEAGFNYLKTRPEVNPHRIGLIGHSEGGVMAPMVAARNPQVAFVVMLAGTGVPGDQILVAQTELITLAAGASHAEAEKAAGAEREVLELVKNSNDDAQLKKELREKLAGKMPEARLGMQMTLIDSPWFRFFVRYDPATALEKVTCPVLALNGEKDLQVPPKLNLPAIRKALQAGGNKNFETDELPGLNHLFQTAKTGSPSEYAEIEETMSPLALEKIAGWILKQ